MPLPDTAEFEQVTVSDVSRVYGRRRALAHVSLTCSAGQIIGVLGPNGVGKSTLLGLLSTLTEPSRGQVRYGDRTAREAGAALRAQVGFLSHDLQLYPELSARENLEFFAGLYGLDRPAERVVEARAGLGAAEALWLPSLVAGFVYTTHSGQLQATTGEVLDVRRTAFFAGGGARLGSAARTQMCAAHTWAGVAERFERAYRHATGPGR